MRTIFFQIYGFFPSLPLFAKNLMQFPGALVRHFLSLIRYYKVSGVDSKYPFTLIDSFPCPYDIFMEAGSVARHYFHMDIWAAKVVYQIKPNQHVDIGSRLDGFISHCLVFSNVTLIDIRPLKTNIEGVSFQKGNATSLDGFANDSVELLSSLHAVDDIGTGRYGDPIDPIGYQKAIAEFQRVVRPGGHIVFAVPIGKGRLTFPGHVFSAQHVVDMFDRCDLINFAGEDDDGTFHPNADIHQFDRDLHACGCFHFMKRP